MEADFMLLQGYRKLKFDSSVKEDKRKQISNLFELLMCNELNPYLHRQEIISEVKTFVLDDMRDVLDPIPTIRIDDGSERTLTPAFVRPLYGFKFITPYFYKNGFYIFHSDLKLISKISSAFTEFAYDINKRGFINAKDRIVKLDLNNLKDYSLLSDTSLRARDATQYHLIELFYGLIKDQVKFI